MTAALALLAVLGWEPFRVRFGIRSAVGVGAALGMMAVSPVILGLVAVGGFGGIAVKRVVRSRHDRQRAEHDVAVLARGLYVAVKAGLSLSSAFSVASVGLCHAVATDVRSLLRAARRDGMALALSEAEGPCSRLFAVLARSHTTGASIGDAIAGFVEEQREARRLKVTEAARRLPVKLTVPLALLILPGFVVLTVGPSVLESGRRLLGPVLPLP